MALSPERKKTIIIIAVFLGILLLAGGITGVIILATTEKPPSPDQKDTDDDDDDHIAPSPEQQKCPENAYTYEDSDGNCIECPSNQYVGPNKTCVYCDSGYEYSRSEDGCIPCNPSKGQFYDEDTHSCGTYCETGVECNINEVCRDGYEKVINNEYQITMCCKEGETIFYKDGEYTCGNWCESEESCSADGICVNDDHTNTQITSLDSVTNYACCPNTDSDGNSITPAWTGTECCTDDKLYYDKDTETFKCCSQDGGVVFNNEDFTDADGNTVNYSTTCCSIDNAEYVYDKNTGTTTYTGNCCSFGTVSLDETEKKTFLDEFLEETDYVLNNYDVQQCVQTENCNTKVGINSDNEAWNEQGAACTTVCGYENENATVKNYCCDADDNSCGDYCSFDEETYKCVNADDGGKTLCLKDNVYVKAITNDGSSTSQGEYCCDTDNNTLTEYKTVDGKAQWTKCCSSDKVLDEGDFSKTCCQDNQYVLPNENSPSTDVCCAKSNVIWYNYNNGSPEETKGNARFCCDEHEMGISTDKDGNLQQECCMGGWLLLPNNSTKVCANKTAEIDDITMVCPSSHTTYVDSSSDELDDDSIKKIWEELEVLYGGKKIYGPNSGDEDWDSNTTYGANISNDESGLIEITGATDFKTYCVRNIGDKQAIVMCLPEELTACDTGNVTKTFPSIIPGDDGTLIYPYSDLIYNQNYDTILETDYINQNTTSDTATYDDSMYWNGTEVARIEQTELPGCNNPVSGLISCLRKMSTTIDSQTNIKYTQVEDDDNPYGLCTKISVPGSMESGAWPDNVQNLLNVSTASDTDKTTSYTAWDNYQLTTNTCEDINECKGNGSWALTGPGTGVCIPHLTDEDGENDYSQGYYEKGESQDSPYSGILSNINVLLVENNSTTGPCPQSDLNSGRIWGNTKATSQAAIEYMNASGTVKITDTDTTTDDEVVIVENRTPYYVKYSYLKAKDSQKGGTSSDHVGTASDGTVYRDRYIENVEYGDSKTADESNGTLDWAELANAKPWNIGTKGTPSDDQYNSFVQGKYYDKDTNNRWGDIKIYLRKNDDSTTPIYLKSLIVSSKTTSRYAVHGERNYRVSFRATGTEINDCKPVKQRENDDKIIIYDKEADNNDNIDTSTIDGLNNRFALFTLEDEEGNPLDGGNHYYTAVVNDHIVIGRVIQLTLDQFNSYGVARSYWRLASIRYEKKSDELTYEHIKETLTYYFPALDTDDNETLADAVILAADDSWAFDAW